MKNTETTTITQNSTAFFESRIGPRYLHHHAKKSLARRFCRSEIEKRSRERELTILEVGCGGIAERTQMENFLKERPNVRFIGTDLTQTSIDLGRSLFPKDTWIKIDITKDRPLSADIVYCSAVLEHCPALSPGLDWILKTARELAIVIFFIPLAEETTLRLSRRGHLPANRYGRADVARVVQHYGFVPEFREFDNQETNCRDPLETVLIARES